MVISLRCISFAASGARYYSAAGHNVVQLEWDDCAWSCGWRRSSMYSGSGLHHWENHLWVKNTFCCLNNLSENTFCCLNNLTRRCWILCLFHRNENLINQFLTLHPDCYVLHCFREILICYLLTCKKSALIRCSSK